MTRKKSIFLLENDNTLRDLIQICLLRAGYEIHSEKKPQQFMDQLRQSKPDLIVVDLFLPGFDSLDLIVQIKGDENFANTPLMVLSAYGFEEIIVQTIKLGVVDFILKPFDTDQFLDKVAKWVNSTHK